MGTYTSHASTPWVFTHVLSSRGTTVVETFSNLCLEIRSNSYVHVYIRRRGKLPENCPFILRKVVIKLTYRQAVEGLVGAASVSRVRGSCFGALRGWRKLWKTRIHIYVATWRVIWRIRWGSGEKFRNERGGCGCGVRVEMKNVPLCKLETNENMWVTGRRWCWFHFRTTD